MATRYPKWPRSEATSVHQDVLPRCGRRLPQGRGHCGTFDLVETLGTNEALGVGTRLDVEYEVGCLDPRVAPVMTRLSTCANPSLDPSSATVPCSSASLASRRRIFISARLAAASLPSATSQRRRAEQQGSPSDWHDSRLISATEKPKSCGNVEIMPNPNAAELREGLVRRPHPHLHAALIGPQLLR